jgi:hypothetical protein
MQWNLVCIGSVVAAAAIWELMIEREKKRERDERPGQGEDGMRECVCLRLVGDDEERAGPGQEPREI